MLVRPPQTGTGTPTGDVSLVLSLTGSSDGTPFGGIEIAHPTLTNGSVVATTNALPGGIFSLTAHYEGDGTFLPSDSTPFGPITVSQESSQTSVQLVLLNPNTGVITFPTSVPYGSNDAIRVNVSSTNASAPCSQNAPGNFACPTGNVTIDKNGSMLDGGTFLLNSLGYTEDQAISATLPPGSYNLQAAYTGDNSFKGSSGSETIAITQATSAITVSASPASISSTASTSLTAVVSTQSFGNPPTGSVVFTLSGGTQLGSSALSGSFNASTGFSQATAVLTVPGSQLQNGSNSITASYVGDVNYSAAPTSLPIVVTVNAVASFNIALAPSAVSIASPGSSGQAILTVTPVNGFNGTISLNSGVCTGLPAESSCSFSSSSINGSGSATLTISTTRPSAVARLGLGVFDWREPLAITLVVFCAALLYRRQPRLRRFAFVVSVAVVASLVIMGACGGGGGGGGGGNTNPGTPVGNDANAVITLTSGPVSKSITFSVNVQ